MNSKLILTFALSLTASSAFALPSSAPFPLAGEVQDSLEQSQLPLTPVAEGGSERTPGMQRIQLAEGGSERTPGMQRIQLAEGGSERTPGMQRIQLAEGGSERT